MKLNQTCYIYKSSFTHQKRMLFCKFTFRVIFKISVNHSDDLIVIGEGKNKQDAEVNAAKLLLKKIENKKI